MTVAMRAILSVFAILAATASAQAHSPYFTRAEKIALPDGTLGEIRLLHGDGVILADPVRAIILDAQGRPLARSPWSHAMVLDCDRQRRCRVFNFDRLQLHVPDPRAFRVEPALDLPNEDFSFVETSGHGFVTRHMSALEVASGYAAYLSQHWLAATVAAATSALAVLFGLFAYVSAPSRTWVDVTLHHFLIAMLALLVAPLFVVLSVLTLLFAAMPILLWLALSSAGAIAAGFLFYAVKRFPRPSLP